MMAKSIITGSVSDLGQVPSAQPQRSQLLVRDCKPVSRRAVESLCTSDIGVILTFIKQVQGSDVHPLLATSCGRGGHWCGSRKERVLGMNNGEEGAVGGWRGWSL